MIKPFVIALVAVAAAGVLAQAQTSPSGAPTDPQIAMIVVTADNVDIAGGKLAAKKSSNPKVKEFAELSLAKLRGLSGAEFDKAYIDNEVTYHEAVIKAMDETLIPNAKNAELKALLESGKPIFVSHLNDAKELQTSLK